MKNKKEKNWFVQQEQKKAQLQATAPSKSTPVKAAPVKVVAVKNPILTVLEKSKKEAQHYKDALAFAHQVSHAKDSALQTIHLTMADTLVFNMPKDGDYKQLWEKGQLALLVTFPRNWKHITLKALIQSMDLDLDEIDEEFEDWDHLDANDRFDLLFEIGLSVYQAR